MSGLRRLCQLYGRIRIQGKLWVWDFSKDEPAPSDEMRKGSERWKESERVRWQSVKEKLGLKP